MSRRQINEAVYWLGAIDWDRHPLDSLIPLPDGTTYNAYLVEGSAKTVLPDSFDPQMGDVLMAQIGKDMKKLKAIDIQLIASSHGQIYDRPPWIMDAYRDWILDPSQKPRCCPC